MSDKLLIFPTPLDARCELIPDDTGKPIVGQPDTHVSGRPGQSFPMPDAVVHRHGGQLLITGPKKVQVLQRGLLYREGESWLFMADDFHLTDEKVCPPCPEPAPPNPTPGPLTPFDRIKAIYKTGKYDLSTKDGCGKFTEACCADLHEHDSAAWGHLQKFPPQNHYPEQPYVPGGKVHAVDAIQLVSGTAATKAGIYDIVFSSESPEAAPAFNLKGAAEPGLWYFPA